MNSALAMLVSRRFTRVRKEPGVHPPSYVCISEPSLSTFAIERAIKALKAAKEIGRAVEQKLLEKGEAPCCSLILC